MAKMLEQGPVMVLGFQAQQLTRKMNAAGAVEDVRLLTLDMVYTVDQTLLKDSGHYPGQYNLSYSAKRSLPKLIQLTSRSIAGFKLYKIQFQCCTCFSISVGGAGECDVHLGAVSRPDYLRPQNCLEGVGIWDTIIRENAGVENYQSNNMQVFPIACKISTI